jgi:nucleoside-diphosphate-sugar epimerase
MTRVLLTGANGYIGRHILLQLLNQGYQVRASVRSLDKTGEIIDSLRDHVKDVNLIDSNLSFVKLSLDSDAGRRFKIIS